MKKNRECKKLINNKEKVIIIRDYYDGSDEKWIELLRLISNFDYTLLEKKLQKNDPV